MTIQEMQKEILRLKKEKDVCILAHTYQSHDVAEIADFTGDSFQLSIKARSAPQASVLMCGVRFMAETVKILSPEKTVYLSNPAAGCPMAEQLTPKQVCDEKKKYPGCMTVAYVNTTAELKAVCDVCVRSCASCPRRTFSLFPTSIWALTYRNTAPKRGCISCTGAVPFTRV